VKELFQDYINIDEIKFVISSHISSYNYAPEKLISSLIKNNIKEQNIIVVCGGNDVKNIKKNTFFTDHNSFDHTALIEIIEEEIDSNLYFVLHDTCEFGNNFSNLLSKYKMNKPFKSITEMAWLNMGLFSNNFIQKNKNYILSLENCSKKRAILSERVFSKLCDYDFFGSQSDVQTIRNCKIYNDSKKRIALYFPYLDFYKYQSYEAQKVMEFKE
jgi:hypothetical protein